MNNSVLEAALTRAAEGLPIFPCSVTDKSPLTPRGHLDATTDPERIRAWWKQHPDALVAYPTGPRSGRDALDLDPRHGSAVWFQASGHRLPPTRVVATRSGGQHWLFRHREGMRNSQNNPAPGVDIRGEGGYVIDWSCHGGELWIDEPLAEWPDWLLAQIATRRATAPRDYAEIRPPSVEAVLDLLAAMPNPDTVDRETWVRIGLAASGCAHALGEGIEEIGDAWVQWSQRWAGAAAEESDRSRWETDLATKNAPKAGWPDLLRHAKRLGVDVSAQRLADAQEQFEADEPEPVAAAEPRLILDRAAPLASAQELIRRRYSRDGARTLHHRNAIFYAWCGTHYSETTQEEMCSAVYRFLDGASYDNGRGCEAFNPNRSRVADVLHALAGEAQLAAHLQAPVWLAGGAEQPAAQEILACANGLLHLPARRLSPHSPRFFTTFAVPFDFEPDAAEPMEWLRFLRTVWPEDQESIDALQELFGLLLTTDTRHQKIFLLIGPKRSGKGTIARVLTALLGRASVVNPTLAGLATNFGLAPLIGKPVALISDARLGNRSDSAAVAERLLSISGEDGLTIDRKFLPAWTGTLPTRFVVLSNELPRLTDASGALAGRFVVLRMVQSFYGREDLGLTNRLLPELPGILNWAMAGLDRLNARGHFVQPSSARQAIEELEDLASPIGAFIRARCITGPEQSAGCDAVFAAWLEWCREQHRDATGTKQSFGRDLRAAVPGLVTQQPRDAAGNRLRHYQGIGLQPAHADAHDPGALFGHGGEP